MMILKIIIIIIIIIILKHYFLKNTGNLLKIFFFLQTFVEKTKNKLWPKFMYLHYIISIHLDYTVLK